MTDWLPNSKSFVFSESEWEWIERRAEEICVTAGDPLPFARSAAIADLVRLRRRPKAEILQFRPRPDSSAPSVARPRRS